MSVSTLAQEALDALDEMITEAITNIDKRVEQLRRIKTSTEAATDEAATAAEDETQNYIDSVRG